MKPRAKSLARPIARPLRRGRAFAILLAALTLSLPLLTLAPARAQESAQESATAPIAKRLEARVRQLSAAIEALDARYGLDGVGGSGGSGLRRELDRRLATAEASWARSKLIGLWGAELDEYWSVGTWGDANGSVMDYLGEHALALTEMLVRPIPAERYQPQIAEYLRGIDALEQRMRALEALFTACFLPAYVQAGAGLQEVEELRRAAGPGPTDHNLAQWQRIEALEKETLDRLLLRRQGCERDLSALIARPVLALPRPDFGEFEGQDGHPDPLGGGANGGGGFGDPGDATAGTAGGIGDALGGTAGGGASGGGANGGGDFGDPGDASAGTAGGIGGALGGTAGGIGGALGGTAGGGASGGNSGTPGTAGENPGLAPNDPGLPPGTPPPGPPPPNPPLSAPAPPPNINCGRKPDIALRLARESLALDRARIEKLTARRSELTGEIARHYAIVADIAAETPADVRLRLRDLPRSARPEILQALVDTHGGWLPERRFATADLPQALSGGAWLSVREAQARIFARKTRARARIRELELEVQSIAAEIGFLTAAIPAQEAEIARLENLEDNVAECERRLRMLDLPLGEDPAPGTGSR